MQPSALLMQSGPVPPPNAPPPPPPPPPPAMIAAKKEEEKKKELTPEEQYARRRADFYNVDVHMRLYVAKGLQHFRRYLLNRYNAILSRRTSNGGNHDVTGAINRDDLKSESGLLEILLDSKKGSGGVVRKERIKAVQTTGKASGSDGA